MNDADFISPALVVTVTVYRVPGDAPGPTVKPPVNVPPEIEQAEEAKRPDGAASKLHEAPAKFEPEAATTVPTTPDPGFKLKVRGPVTVKGAPFVSPAFVVTVTA